MKCRSRNGVIESRAVCPAVARTSLVEALARLKGITTFTFEACVIVLLATLTLATLTLLASSSIVTASTPAGAQAARLAAVSNPRLSQHKGCC